MPDIIRITSVTDPRLQDYTDLKDIALRSVREPAEGLYMAESSTVIRRALAAGHRPRSLLMADKWLPSFDDLFYGPTGSGPTSDTGLPGSGSDNSANPAIPADTPVFVGDQALLEQITGFHLHRGALAAMHRPQLPSVEHLLAQARGGLGARRVAVLENIVDHTNVGAAFRSAAALGVDAVLVTPRCADPLYRRSVRVSMGTIFQVPWTRLEAWPAGIQLLQEAGFVVAALALTDDALSVDDVAAAAPERLALVLGTEGHGLTASAIAACDMTVKIPMAPGVDSLNVAAASAVAFYATRA